MAGESATETILGLDIGAQSVGWALIKCVDGNPAGLLDLGARVFEAGVEGDIETGRDESRNAARRGARQVRRQLERRQRRMTNLAALLQRHGLLPDGDVTSDTNRDAMLKELDRSVSRRHAEAHAKGKHAALAQLPYFLRARALDNRLEPDELARALYHLAQRRGFLSNRKVTKKDEEEGVVKTKIAELAANIEQSGARTLGDYFARLDPHTERIRQRWTSRQMYMDEFEAIWAAQQGHHPQLLTDSLKADVYRAIFHQRPLKVQKHLVGECELERDGAEAIDQASGEVIKLTHTRKRAQWALLDAQRFRILQKVNDIKLIAPDFRERPLTAEERAHTLDLLEHHRELKFTTLRKELKHGKGCTFNLERGGEEKLIGNKTAAQLRQVFGDRWDQFDQDQRDHILEDLLSIQKPETLKRRAMNAWGLDAEAAAKFAELSLEPGYCRLSRQALARVLPLMEQGTAFKTAEKEVYGRGPGFQPTQLLPMVDDAPIVLRNPAVHRTLTELRKVVNAIIAKHGKPDVMRIELARDLKRSREERKQTWKKNRQNERARVKAKERILDELAGSPQPKRADVEKVLLAEECNWQCPYTGKSISMAALLGPEPQFDVEHIIPYCRVLDDSFVNKTLCYHEVNRTIKRNRTPFEAFGSNAEEWDPIIERVKRFNSDARDAKLRRFLMKDLDSFDDFTARQLNDTRYASTLAANYLALLYGGQIDASHRRRIQAGRGQVTADLRSTWNLNKILGDGGQKSRDDHRHHAVDAVAIALTDANTVKALSTANEKAGKEGRRAWWKDVPLPWDSFLQDVQTAIDGVIVSHRVSRKVSGPLHEETIYSPEHLDEDGKPWVHVRKPLDALSANEVDAIVDPVVRSLVKAKLEDLGSSDPKKAFTPKDSHPCLTTEDGRHVPIHKVRLRKTLSTFSVGEGARQRHVVPKENHHMEILEVTDKRGNTKWEDVIVDQYTALHRLKMGHPIVQRDHGPGKRLVMSLTPGDVLELANDNGARGLYVLRSISKNDLMFADIADARRKKGIMAAGEWVRANLSRLRNRNVRKVTLCPLGGVRRAND